MQDHNEGLAAVAAAATEGVRDASAKVEKPVEAEGNADALGTGADASAGTVMTAEDARLDERKRLLGIDRITLPGCEGLASAAKEEGSELGAFAIAQCEEVLASGRLDAVAQMAAAAETVPAIEAGANDPVGDAAKGEAENATPETKASSRWDADPKLRAEFGGSKEAYIAFAAAESRGVIRTKQPSV